MDSECDRFGEDEGNRGSVDGCHVFVFSSSEREGMEGESVVDHNFFSLL